MRTLPARRARNLQLGKLSHRIREHVGLETMDDFLLADVQTLRLHRHIGGVDSKIDTAPACSLVYQKAGLQLEDGCDVELQSRVTSTRNHTEECSYSNPI